MRFILNGKEIQAHAGESVAAALLAAGQSCLRDSPRLGQPRGAFCWMGLCQECTMVIDGTRQPSCRVRAATASSCFRGPSRDHDVRCRRHRRRPGRRRSRARGRKLRPVRRAGRRGTGAGGQVYRAPPPGFTGLPSTPEGIKGEGLRRRLADSAVVAAFDHAVWSVSPGFRVDAMGPGGPTAWQGRTVVVATGAQERVVPFPGWTLPGVMGLAGATILLKSQRMLPGRRTLVAGQGPLLLAVAAGILQAGGMVAAVVDLASRRDWLADWGALTSRPDLAARGAGWLFRLRRAGVPLLARHAVRRIEARAHDQLAVLVGAVDAEGRPAAGATRDFAVDAVAVGNGLTASTDVTRLLRADHVFDEARGGWHPRTGDDGRTSVRGLYAVGDGAGIAGASSAETDGRLAGLAVARDLGALSDAAHAAAAAPLRRVAVQARRFGGAMARLMALRPGQIESIPPDTIVCRCEDVTRREIDAAAQAGSQSLNQVKAWTRCGMGPCQGRICGDIVGALLARQTGQRERAGLFTGRAPFRPLPVDQLVGAVVYADLELPPPAPL